METISQEDYLIVQKFIAKRLARSIDDPDVCDITQETFKIALKKINKYDKTKCMFITFVCSIAKKKCQNYISKKCNGTQHDFIPFDAASTSYVNPTDDFEQIICNDLVDSSLSAFNPKEQSIISLKIYDEKTIDEIYKQTGSSHSTIKRTLKKYKNIMNNLRGDIL